VTKAVSTSNHLLLAVSPRSGMLQKLPGGQQDWHGAGFIAVAMRHS